MGDSRAGEFDEQNIVNGDRIDFERRMFVVLHADALLVDEIVVGAPSCSGLIHRGFAARDPHVDGVLLVESERGGTPFESGRNLAIYVKKSESLS